MIDTKENYRIIRAWTYFQIFEIFFVEFIVLSNVRWNVWFVLFHAVLFTISEYKKRQMLDHTQRVEDRNACTQE